MRAIRAAACVLALASIRWRVFRRGVSTMIGVGVTSSHLAKSKA